MLKLLRAIFHEPLLSGLVIGSVLLVIALVISAATERKRNRKLAERREWAKKHHQLSLQRTQPPGNPNQPGRKAAEDCEHANGS
jgi:hypothetical protein